MIVATTFNRVYCARFRTIYVPLLVALFAFIAAAQPEFTSELRMMKEKGRTEAVPHMLPQERFPMPTSSFGNARALVDSSLDPGFNTAVTEGNGIVRETAVQSDGKIIAVGSIHGANSVRGINGIVRFNANGALDSTFNARVFRFNADGTRDQGFGQVDMELYPAFDLRILDDGKILAGGTFVAINGNTHLRIARLNSDGSPDASFAAVTHYRANVRVIRAIPGGKTMIGGDFDFVDGVRTRGGIARLNANGTLDATFSVGNELYGDVETAFYPAGRKDPGCGFCLKASKYRR